MDVALSLSSCLSLRVQKCSVPALAATTNEPPDALIYVVCVQTKNESLCQEALRSYPLPSEGLDFQILCQASIAVSNADAKSTYNLIGSLKRNESDPMILHELDLCLYAYELSIRGIGKANNSLIARDYDGLYKIAVNNQVLESNCETGFVEKGLDEPIQLKEAGKKFQDLGDITVVIAKHLKDMKH